MSIKKAILPVAGLGTRFLPAAKAQPKEMLPIFDTPSIQFIVEEAVEAGIKEIIVVTGPRKDAIEHHFERNPELELMLLERGKKEELEMVRKISSMAHFTFVRQEEPLGDGHAIACALDLVEKNESVVVLFGDDIVDTFGKKNAVQQLLQTYEKTKSPVILLEEIDRAQSEKYGMVKITSEGKIKKIVEKPKPEDSPSDMSIVGKFILTPKLLKKLKTTMPGDDREIRLSSTLSEYIKKGGDVYGKVLEGKRFDTGDKIGFLKATLHFALKKENGKAKEALREFLEEQ